MKRRRVSSSLTGGTGDVSPQWLTATAAGTATGAVIETSIQLPITRIPQSGVATIIEVLATVVDWNDVNAAGAAAQGINDIVLTFGTKSFGTTANNAIGEPTVFSAHRLVFQNAFTAAGTGFSNYDGISYRCLDDGAGHGVLIATDKMYIQTQIRGGTIASTSGNVWVKMLYRFKSVSIEEYVGIVQSQQ